MNFDNELVVGIDEVGRGCWAGPLVVGAVILPVTFKQKLSDSKVLGKEDRVRLAEIIKRQATYCSTGWVEAAEVDAFGLTAATILGIERAIKNIQKYDRILIDGNFNYLSKNPKAVAVVKADALYPSVSAASIVAKVERDRFMAECANDYPDYGFATNVGYGTKSHIKGLIERGVTPLHRKTYKPVIMYTDG